LHLITAQLLLFKASAKVYDAQLKSLAHGDIRLNPHTSCRSKARVINANAAAPPRRSTRLFDLLDPSFEEALRSFSSQKALQLSSPRLSWIDRANKPLTRNHFCLMFKEI
jgi:hypothetical protein